MSAMSSVTPACGSTTAISASPNSSSGMPNTAQSCTPGTACSAASISAGIDVDAAGDHHVALAVADEDIAVRVDIADIARGDKTVAVDLGALFRLVVIGEIRIARDPRIDLADLALRQYSSVLADEAQLRAGRNPADGAGLLQRVLGIGEGDRARFGRAVEFMDHRPPPFDHRALDVGGTGCGGVDRRDAARTCRISGAPLPAASSAG